MLTCGRGARRGAASSAHRSATQDFLVAATAAVQAAALGCRWRASVRHPLPGAHLGHKRDELCKLAALLRGLQPEDVEARLVVAVLRREKAECVQEGVRPVGGARGLRRGALVAAERRRGRACTFPSWTERRCKTAGAAT